MNEQKFPGASHMWLDGEVRAIADTNVCPFTHGLHYGSSVFEGIRAYDSKPFKLREHMLRLFHSASVMGMHIKYKIEELEKAAYEILEKNNLQNAYIRPLVYKGNDSLRLNADVTIHCLIAAWQLGSYHKDEKASNGLKLTFSHLRKMPAECVPFSAKIGGLYAINQIVKNYNKDFDDMIMLDTKGFIAECTTSNIFIVKNGRLLTPIADCFLNGLTRQTILQLANEYQIPALEVRLTKEELLNADEVFITGTAVEVMPVNSIDDTKFNIGPVTLKLKDLYSNLVRRDL